MRTTTTGLQITQRTVYALACLMLGLGALFVGLATSATASDHGANQSGPYDPANVGEGDNQGNGNAPDNGTVGKADAKNPPGQYPDGSDHDKGYECDDNRGIGDNGGNPAHSGCVTAAAGDGDGDGDGDVLGTESFAPGGDGDGDGDGDDGAEVLGTEADAPAAVPTAVDAGGTTGETGASSSLWLLAGAALVLVGAAIGLTPRVRGRRSW